MEVDIKQEKSVIWGLNALIIQINKGTKVRHK